MGFISLEFLVFVPLIIGLNYLLKGKYRLLFLLIASFYYYLTFAYKYSFAILVLILVSYMMVLILISVKRPSVRKLVLFASVIFPLGVLFYFKYYGFVLENISALGFHLNLKASPPFFFVGISYIAFQIVAYNMDVYYNRISAERNIIVYSLFILFFPKVLSGPIERGDGLLAELKKSPELKYDNIAEGIKFFVWGFFSKVVIAERLSIAVENVFTRHSEYSGPAVLLGVIFFTFQLYSDFMGYSFMALGVSKMLGFNLINNFQMPFFSQSISEFWRRWHISLSSWLRDYLFLPLSYFVVDKMKRVSGLTRKTDSTAYIAATIITMTICGLWHGAGWTFVVWGLLHGIYMIVSLLTKKLRKNVLKKTGLKNSDLTVKILRMIINFCLVAFTFIFFKSDTLADSLNVLKSLFGKGSAGIWSLFRNQYDLIISFAALAILFITEWLQYKNDYKKISQVVNFYFVTVLILIIIIFGKFGESDFIYFKF